MQILGTFSMEFITEWIIFIKIFIPVFKEKDPVNKENYRPISVLPIILKIFKTIMHKQINGYINNFLPLYSWRHRRGFSTQLAIL